MSATMMSGLYNRCLRILNQSRWLGRCQKKNISTSKKNKETITTTETAYRPKAPETAEEFADVKSQKHWISYGWDIHSKKNDRLQMHVSFFTSVTLVMVFGTFVVMYYPDFKRRDWHAREAFLELHRREKLGLPLIDKNFIDPAHIELPSDEELGDTEIII